MTDGILDGLLLGAGSRVVEIQRRLTAIPAIGPENGGQGEWEKALAIEEMLGSSGLRVERHDCPDERVQSGKRPNLVAVLQDISRRRLWLFGHMDVVPAGDPRSWRGDPWSVRQSGDFLTGRGVEDNQQAICSMILLAEALISSGVVPCLGLGLVFMADEECGSSKGLKWLLRESPQLFSPDDLYIVPDGGSPDGGDIEIAEKAQLWLKFVVSGAQCHASMPHLGKNALLGASSLIMALDGLNHVYSCRNDLFKPPFSTFVPSRHEENVPSINILPGKETFYMDCRLLPGVDKSEVLEKVRAICAMVDANHNLRTDFEVVHWQPATEVKADSPVIAGLAAAIAEIYKVEARLTGIGGATVAAMLRERGLGAVVWSCLENTCHQPEERSSIRATCRDAAVFGRILQGCADIHNV